MRDADDRVRRLPSFGIGNLLYPDIALAVKDSGVHVRRFRRGEENAREATLSRWPVPLESAAGRPLHQGADLAQQDGGG